MLTVATDMSGAFITYDAGAKWHMIDFRQLSGSIVAPPLSIPPSRRSSTGSKRMKCGSASDKGVTWAPTGAEPALAERERRQAQWCASGLIRITPNESSSACREQGQRRPTVSERRRRQVLARLPRPSPGASSTWRWSARARRPSAFTSWAPATASSVPMTAPRRSRRKCRGCRQARSPALPAAPTTSRPSCMPPCRAN